MYGVGHCRIPSKDCCDVKWKNHFYWIIPSARILSSDRYIKQCIFDKVNEHFIQVHSIHEQPIKTIKDEKC